MLQNRHHLGLGKLSQLYGRGRPPRQRDQPGLPRAADPVSPLRDGRGIDGPGGHSPKKPQKIAALLREAVAAGALGFSHTTGIQHVGYKGRPLACRLANRDELGSYAQVLRDLGKGVIEITLTQNFGHIQDHELDLLKFLLDESGRPVTWLAIFDREDQPQASAETLQRAEPLIKRGGVPQMTCRPLIAEFEHERRVSAFSMMRSWQPACDQPPEKLKEIYADPAFRQRRDRGNEARSVPAQLGAGRHLRSRQARVQEPDGQVGGPDCA